MKEYDIEKHSNERTEYNYNREEAYLRAKKKVEKITGFYWHLASYIVVNIFILIMIARHTTTEQFWTFGTFSTIIFWGIGLLFHGLGVFGPQYMFGKAWEKRKIEEYMEKERNRWE
jgi:hypothetical protein